jgi:hypothetical protein
MNRQFFNGACLFAGLALFAVPAQADRRTSLAGNDLIQDADDVFLFPQTLQQYQNRLTLDLGAAAGAGGGLFSLGNDAMTFGVAIHRAPQEQTMIGWQSRDRELDGLGGFGLGLDAGLGLTEANENIDILFAYKLSDALDFGLRLGFGRGLGWQEQEVPNDDGDGTRSRTDSSDQNALHIALGGGYKANNLDLDSVLRITKLGGSQITDGKSVLTASDLNIALSARAYFNMSKGFDLGTLFSFNNGSGWALDSSADEKVTSVWNGNGVIVGAGPRLQIDKGPLVAAYAVLAYQSSNLDPDNHGDATEDTADDSEIMIPGIRMAGEYNVKSWIKARVGMEYNFITAKSNGFNGGNSINQEELSSDFGWNAGLGFTFDDLQIDATLNHGSLYFLWQDAPFAMISATYSFGKLNASAPGKRIERRQERRQEPRETVQEEAPEEAPPARSRQVEDDDF